MQPLEAIGRRVRHAAEWLGGRSREQIEAFERAKGRMVQIGAVALLCELQEDDAKVGLRGKILHQDSDLVLPVDSVLYYASCIGQTDVCKGVRITTFGDLKNLNTPPKVELTNGHGWKDVNSVSFWQKFKPGSKSQEPLSFRQQVKLAHDRAVATDKDELDLIDYGIENNPREKNE